MAMTLKALAEQLGLSITTVSRALNGYPEVSEATRQRVEEAALRLGYQPNVSARGLVTGRLGAVGVFLPSLGNKDMGPHSTEFLSGLAERLAQDEIDIVVSPFEGNREEEIYRRLAAAKRVDALVISNPRPNDGRIRFLNELGLPYVLHGRTDVDAPHAWLDIDNEMATYKATRCLVALGHKRIALVNGPAGMTYSVHRERGYRRALRESGLDPVPAFIANDIFTDETGFRIASGMLARNPAPTAFLAGSMMTGLGTFRAIRSAGLELGRDVSMIAHDDVFPYLNADKMVPAVSTTRSSIRKAGYRIGEMILQLLEGADPQELHELWPVDLILRESTAPPPDGRSGS